MSEHWTDDFEHASITTDEQRETFNKSMEKFPTQGDAAIGYVELQKSTGAPFKFPDSMDKLPDDASRTAFTSKARELLGIVPGVKTIDELNDIDMRAGLADDVNPDETLVKMLKDLAVENGWPKSMVQKLIDWNNGPLAKYANDSIDASNAKALTDKVEAAKLCDEELAKHADFGSADKVKEQMILMERAVISEFGLDTEQAEKFAKNRLGSICDTDPVMKRILLKTLAPLASTSKDQGGGDGNPPAVPVDPDEGSPSYIALGFSEKKN